MSTPLLHVSGRPADIDGVVDIRDVLDPTEELDDAVCSQCGHRGALVRRSVRHVPDTTKCALSGLR